jgi:hypothetical protein
MDPPGERSPDDDSGRVNRGTPKCVIIFSGCRKVGVMGRDEVDEEINWPSPGLVSPA